jgi:hypothetical protein
MMPPHPLALSQDQFSIVLDAAKQVPPQWRHRFLDGVVDQLLFDTDDVIQTADVISAVHLVLHRIGVTMA